MRVDDESLLDWKKYDENKKTGLAKNGLERLYIFTLLLNNTKIYYKTSYKLRTNLQKQITKVNSIAGLDQDISFRFTCPRDDRLDPGNLALQQTKKTPNQSQYNAT